MQNLPVKTNKILNGLTKISAIVLLAFMAIACGNNEDQSARLELRLTDAPGDYEEVNIDIQGVEIHSSESDQNEDWEYLDVENGVYNLLELTNGLDTLLATAVLPVGRISQIRLILGENNTIKIDGVLIPLSTPSAQQSGLKINLQVELKEGITNFITLDFDAGQSIVNKGNGEYSLKPVIRAIVEATSGSIKGSINPLEASPAIFAIRGSDTISSVYTDATGRFLLRGLPAGNYTISFDPKEGFMEVQKQNVSVAISNVTDLGIIDLL